MAVAGLLAQYMSIKAQISYVELQDTRWNNLATDMSKKVSEQSKLEDKYEEQYDKADSAFDAMNSGDPEELSGAKTGKVIKKDGDKANVVKGDFKSLIRNKAAFCEKFAHENVPKFDRGKLDEYTDLDMEYSTMVAMYDTLLEELNTQAESTKNQLSTESQDNHMLGQ